MTKPKLVNITHLTEIYGPGYIAKDKKTGKVIAHASRVDDLMNKLEDKKNKEVVISWVPKHGARYVFKISLFVIHASITNTEEVGLPFLLGRKDVFDKRYSLEIDSKSKMTILKRNK